MRGLISTELDYSLVDEFADAGAHVSRTIYASLEVNASPDTRLCAVADKVGSVGEEHLQIGRGDGTGLDE